MSKLRSPSFVKAILLANLIMYFGRLVYAILLSVLGEIALLWLPPEEVGSAAWAYRALVSWQKTLPYLVWATVASILWVNMKDGFSASTVKASFLVVAAGLWIHTSRLGILSVEYWRFAWNLEVLWAAVFFPLFWGMHPLLRYVEDRLDMEGKR